MKKLLTILLLLISAAAFASDPFADMIVHKKPHPYYLADNTAAIQAAINAGNYTLPTGTYSVTTLYLTHSFNMGGNSISCIGTSGGCLMMNTPGVTANNGTLVGTSDVSNASGVSAIKVLASNVTIDHMTIHTFPASGIVGDGFSNLTITNNNISDVGYIGMALYSSTNTSGWLVNYNHIDRSAQGTSVVQEAIILRSQNGGVNTGTILQHNVVTMPSSPLSATAEGIEARGVVNADLSYNKFIGGSMGISAVQGCTGLKARQDTCMGQSIQGIELGDSKHALLDHDYIPSGHIGILLDGATTDLQDTIQYANISGLTGTNPYPIQANINSANKSPLTSPVNDVFNNNTIVTTTQAIYITYANGFLINYLNATGNNTTCAIFFNTSIGNLTANNLTLSGFNMLSNAYALSTTVVDHLTFTSTTPTGSFLGCTLLNSYVTLGTNIVYNPTIHAPNISYSPSTNVLAVNKFMTLSPINTGDAALSWSISPNLATNTGLQFSTGTGVISGTPTISSAATNYTVSATNSAGTGTFVVNISTVNAPVISYNPASYIFNTGVVSTTSAPISTGGLPSGYTITGSLPAGLSFNTSTGVISGTPTATSLPVSYPVTATNGVGSSTASVTITVNASGTGYVNRGQVTISNKSDTTYRGIWFNTTNCAACLSLSNCQRVRFVNCVFGASAPGCANGVGAQVYQCQNITFDSCYYEKVSTGVFMTFSQSCSVTHCQFKNMQGPAPQGSAIRYYQCSGPNQLISQNAIENIDGQSNPQDIIDIYKSSGASYSPLTISYNQIRCNVPISATGGAIKLGDNGGTYQTAQYNTIVSPGSYGLAIAGGQHNILANNTLFSPRHVGSLIANMAISVANVTPSSGICEYNTVGGNQVKWYSDFNFATGGVYNLFNPGTCNVIKSLNSNNYNANIDATILPTQIITKISPIQ